MIHLTAGVSEKTTCRLVFARFQVLMFESESRQSELIPIIRDGKDETPLLLHRY